MERTFLDYWSNLQYRSWADVAAYYDPPFRAFVGTSALIGAKKLNASNYPLLRPKIVRVNTDRGDTTVYYTLTLLDGTKELDSVTWRKGDGNWQIIYDSRLDAELSQLASNHAEIAKSGSLATDASSPPSPQAMRAGNAAEQQQARFLEEDLKTSSP